MTAPYSRRNSSKPPPILIHTRLTDGTQTYVQVNTLLEPANNSSAMQHDKEEIREVSTQLSQIKKKHDETKRICINKQAELDALKEEIRNLGV